MALFLALRSKTYIVCYMLLITAPAMGYGTIVDMDISTDDCQEAQNVSVRVSSYYGWPFSLSCDALRQRWNQTFGNPFSLEDSQCFVKDPSTNTYNSTDSLVLESYMPALTIFQLYQISCSQCLTAEVNVSLLPFPSNSCEEVVGEAASCKHNVQNLRFNIDDIMELRCIGAPDSDTILPPSVNASLYSTQWLYTRLQRNRTVLRDHSCQAIENVTNLQLLHIDPDPGHPHKLIKKELSFYDPGLYTCAVTHDGQTAYISHYSVCVHQRPKDDFDPQWKCDQEDSFFGGDEISINCKGRKNVGRLSPGDLRVQLSKETTGDVLCKIDDFRNVTDGRVSCGLLNFVNYDRVCYSHQLTQEELNELNTDQTFQVFFKLRNTDKNDAGRYLVNITYKGESSALQFKLVFDPLHELRRIAIICCVVLVLVVLLALAVYFSWQYQTLIKLFYRRHFGEYDEDDKKYAAFLSYVYDENMPDDIKSTTVKIVRSIRKKLDELQYNYYDPQEQFELGFEFEIMLKNIRRSHRMIVVLTEAYADDAFARKVVEQGAIDMQDNHVKVVFVSTPNVDQIIRKRRDQPHMNELENALTVCRNIVWKNKPDRRFMADIEHALPKLRENNRPTQGQVNV